MWSEAAPQSEAQQSSSPESVIFILINLYFLKNSPVKIKTKTKKTSLLRMNPGQDSNMEIHRKRNKLLLSKSFCKFVANYSLNTNNYNNNNRQDDKLKKGLIKKKTPDILISPELWMHVCVCVCKRQRQMDRICVFLAVCRHLVFTLILHLCLLSDAVSLKDLFTEMFLVMERKAEE